VSGALGRLSTPGLSSAAVHWFFTGLLIAASAGTVAFTGLLLRRLFTTAPEAAATLTASFAAPAPSDEEPTT
jgi:hypothetical protein